MTDRNKCRDSAGCTIATVAARLVRRWTPIRAAVIRDVASFLFYYFGESPFTCVARALARSLEIVKVVSHDGRKCPQSFEPNVL